MNKTQQKFIEKVSYFIQTYFNLKKVTADFIAAQFALESAFGESPLAKIYNNFCGMKVPRVRISTCTNFNDQSDATWASYDNLQQCICDYILWLQYQKPLRSELDEPKKLQPYFKRYCPEKDYFDKITKIFNDYVQTTDKNTK